MAPQPATYSTRFLSMVNELLTKIVEEEDARIREAAKLVANAAANGHLLHVVGAGHSAMLAEELFYRAGGLAIVNPIIDTDITVAHGARRSTAMEYVRGYAEALLKTAGVGEGDVVLVVSTSGVNVFPVEAALTSKELGAAVVAITSVRYSTTLEPRNPWGKRLCEVADVVIDNKVPRGDAVLEIEGFPMRVGPVSTITNSFIADVLVAYAVEELVRRGVTPPVWLSAHLPEASKHNEELFKKYSKVVKLL